MFLYIHIPFCESKCKYCHFASTGKLQNLQISKYVDNIFETGLIGDRSHLSFKSIYFGGGTPGILNLKQIKKILSNYNYSKETEITLETTPNKITKENLIGWQAFGINRISMGVQSLNNDTLKEIGREDKGDIIKAFELIGNSNIVDVSIDFIIGLPYVKKGGVKKDIEYILDKYDFITHISVYMLEDYYYPGNWQESSIKEEDYLGEYIEVKTFLESKGFNKYEISNFAKPGYECKHNMAYWNHSEVKAIGLSASGYEKGERYTFSDKFKDFYEKRGIFKEKLTKSDIFIEKVMFGLRTSGISEDLYINLDKKKVDNFIKEKLFFIQNKKLKLTDKGILVLDYIIGEIV